MCSNLTKQCDQQDTIYASTESTCIKPSGLLQTLKGCEDGSFYFEWYKVLLYYMVSLQVADRPKHVAVFK
jgi:hypothetical protein